MITPRPHWIAHAGKASRTKLSNSDIEALVNNTVAVKTQATDRIDDWRTDLSNVRSQVAAMDDTEADLAFIDALLALLDGQTPAFPEDHPYHEHLNRLQANILHHLGMDKWRANATEDALNYYQQALSLRQAINDTEGEALELHSIGHTLFGLERYSEVMP